MPFLELDFFYSVWSILLLEPWSSVSLRLPKTPFMLQAAASWYSPHFDSMALDEGTLKCDTKLFFLIFDLNVSV